MSHTSSSSTLLPYTFVPLAGTPPSTPDRVPTRKPSSTHSIGSSVSQVKRRDVLLKQGSKNPYEALLHSSEPSTPSAQRYSLTLLRTVTHNPQRVHSCDYNTRSSTIVIGTQIKIQQVHDRWRQAALTLKPGQRESLSGALCVSISDPSVRLTGESTGPFVPALYISIISRRIYGRLRTSTEKEPVHSPSSFIRRTPMDRSKKSFSARGWYVTTI